MHLPLEWRERTLQYRKKSLYNLLQQTTENGSSAMSRANSEAAIEGDGIRGEVRFDGFIFDLH